MVEFIFNVFLLLFFGYYAYASAVVISERNRFQKEANKVEDKNAKRDS